MPDFQYSMNPINKKPEQKPRGKPKGSSKYAPIIETFLESEHKLVKVENTKYEAYYLCQQLKKVCENRGIDLVNISVRNKKVYLEKI